MISFSQNAQDRLNRYLQQVQTSLVVCKSVDPDEVERDITEHIERELEGASEPVCLDELEAVLKKLGRPDQWVPDEALPWWRKAVLRLRKGPEDWRLAYIAFALLLFGLLLLAWKGGGAH